MMDFEYRVKTTGQAISLTWYGTSASQVRKEVEDYGHRVKSVYFIRPCPVYEKSTKER